MKKEDNFPWGAKIERGEVIATREDEHSITRYDVKSIDRPGVFAYGLLAMNGLYSKNVDVYFFLFGDGKGMILSEIA